MDPSVKHLVKLIHENTYEGMMYRMVTVARYPSRIFWNRNFNDILERDLKVNNTIKAAMMSFSSYVFMRECWRIFR
jgi:hypothetical protein